MAITYKELFAASEQKAHNRNIATKILRELSQLRSYVETSPTASKRWIWELIQNAKDVNIAGKIRIRIDADLHCRKPQVTFTHNGQPFSAENIRFLIEQVSSKDRNKDAIGRPKTSGKFGTGFLTTHLLSEVVLIRGIAKDEGLEPRKFDLLLDRRGFDLEAITAAVEEAKNAVQDLDDRPPYRGYVSGAFNTAFRYELADETGRNVAKAGLADLDVCLPYTLAFVREIDSVELLLQKYSLTTSAVLKEGEVQVLSVDVANSRSTSDSCSHSIAVLSKGFTTIAIPITPVGESVHIIAPGQEVPRLFCDFPLLGTEAFPFPVLINNPNFNPTDARDGVFLTQTARFDPEIEENKRIVKEALSLYFSLLEHASDNAWQNLHLLAAARPIPSDLRWVDPSWYKREVLTPIRSVLLRAKIVRTATGALASILSPDGKKYIRFPIAGTKELRATLWQSGYSWFPDRLPSLSDVEVWHDLIWEDCGKLTLGKLAELVEAEGSIGGLSPRLTDKNVYEWLNEFYALLTLDGSEYDALINRHRLFPNQNGDFRRKSELYRDAGDIEPVFKDILDLLRHDLRDRLLASEIGAHADDLEERDLAYAVKEITAAVQEKTADREVAKRFRPAFAKLLRWFRENGGRANSLFPVLYRHKHLLYDDDEILDNIERAEQLSALLAEYNVASVQELRNALEKHSKMAQLLPVTQEIIATMGIASVDEWVEALKDKDLALLFSGSSGNRVGDFGGS